MKKKIISSVILTLVFAVGMVGVFFSPSETKVSGQEQERGWKVWIKTDPCPGRQDWLSVAKEQWGGGKNTYIPYDTVFGNQGCTLSGRGGCTFAEAQALMESLRGDDKFFDYCCRDYSVWENTQTGKKSVVLGKFGTAGFGWRFIKGDLCCEEAEELSGISGACSGSKRGGGTGWGSHEEGSINQGDGQTLTYYRGTTSDQCQADCDKNPRCVAFTLIKAGAFSPNDPPMCYLMSEAKKVTPSSCCITAIKSKGGSGGGGDTTAIDLSGTWYAVVTDTNGKWDYTMTLSRASAGKWTGTMTVTLNGTSPYTSNVAVESLGGGKILYVWYVGGSNAQQFTGTHTKDRISVAGYGAQLVFSRR